MFLLHLIVNPSIFNEKKHNFYVRLRVKIIINSCFCICHCIVYAIEALSLYVHSCIKTNMYDWWRDRLSFLIFYRYFVQCCYHYFSCNRGYVYLYDKKRNSFEVQQNLHFFDCRLSSIIVLLPWLFVLDIEVLHTLVRN